MRILIVEASDSILKMIEALVSARGFEVAGANSGARAVEDAIANTPEIVVVDFSLPAPMDAAALCKRLREDADMKLIPIIAIGEAGDEAIRQRALESGATTYYTKPFSPISLLKEIDAIKAKLRSSGTEKVQQ
jgi:DNA-binding response OmpR family regulator